MSSGEKGRSRNVSYFYYYYYYYYARFDDIDNEVHSGSAKRKKEERCVLSVIKQAISIKIAARVGHFSVTWTLTLQTFIWLDH